jgi:acetoin utilization deacetylase AcuC-like enzyme
MVMKIFEHRNHVVHEARVELVPGKFVPCLDSSLRIGAVLNAVADLGLGTPVDSPAATREDLLQIHTADYLDFLENAWTEWCVGYDPSLDGTPFVWPHRNRPPRCPATIEGRMGYYFFDGVSPITAGMWPASIGAAGAAVAASRFLQDANRPCLAVSRPPGHHAAADLGGGTSYINHTALAAARLAKMGARVAILDVDAHHGNGTQAIFWDTDQVLTMSIHADPAFDYPYFSGYADEIGRGPGENFNVNLPLAPGSTWEPYADALRQAELCLQAFGADYLVIALGVDSYEKDPAGKLALVLDDFSRLGDFIASLRIPTMFVFEGGYDLEAIGGCVTRVLAPNDL